MDAPWRIELLGGLRAVQAGTAAAERRVITQFRTQKTGALLAYLARNPQRTHPRDHLIELFWPDADLPAGSNSLSQALSSLRSQLEPSDVPPGTVLVANRASVRLNPDAVTTDLAELEAALHAAASTAEQTERRQWLAEAVGLYRGELLAGYYEPWVLEQREWAAESYFQALRELLALLEQEGDLSRALAYARRGAEVDPLREEAHVELIRLYAAAGQPVAALRQYRKLERLLQKELGAVPAPTTQALVREIERWADVPAPSAAPPGHETGTHKRDPHGASPRLSLAGDAMAARVPNRELSPRHNLPLQLTRFIGRGPQVAEVRQILTPSGFTDAPRLVTLVGAGGCGKTRLALEAAAGLIDASADGVWLIELAALSDPARVSQSVAATLGIREEPGRPPIAVLRDALRPRSMLLVLDNCEHLLAACAELVEVLLRACPNVRVLATSRQGLGITGEQTYPVPPLSVPDPDRLPPVERLLQYEAVQLFVDRAGLSQPTFRLTEANAPWVAQVCHRLDGIPLAIELAAARVKALPVEQIAERLDDRFRLLTAGSPTALPRHQTLRALIDWSYDLLSEPERVLLARLSVFAGGWTLEAAEAVCSGEGIEARDALDGLSSLVEKSLVQYEERDAQARYRLLETVREYGRIRLAACGEEAAVRGDHLLFFARWTEAAAEHLTGAQEGAWMDRFETEHDNLRAALAWAREIGAAPGGSQAVELGLRLVIGMANFWYNRGYLAEGREQLAGVLALAGTAPEALRARAIDAAARIARSHRDYLAARALSEEALAIYRNLEDQHGIAVVVTELATIAALQGDIASARQLFAESLSLSRAVGDAKVTGVALNDLGLLEVFEGNYAEASALLKECLAINRTLRYPFGISRALNNLGIVALGEGHADEAHRLFSESLRMKRNAGRWAGIPWTLAGLAGVAAAQGQRERAARLFGAAAAGREPIGNDLPPDFAERVAALRPAMGEQAFAAAWAAGSSMSLQQAVEYALEEISHA
jgi:predicted ATPase/DNA-binding SARP family transcriptional activator/Tfp pilus assembly protein PilF